MTQLQPALEQALLSPPHPSLVQARLGSCRRRVDASERCLSTKLEYWRASNWTAPADVIVIRPGSISNALLPGICAALSLSWPVLHEPSCFTHVEPGLVIPVGGARQRYSRPDSERKRAYAWLRQRTARTFFSFFIANSFFLWPWAITNPTPGFEKMQRRILVTAHNAALHVSAHVRWLVTGEAGSRV